MSVQEPLKSLVSELVLAEASTRYNWHVLPTLSYTYRDLEVMNHCLDNMRG